MAPSLSENKQRKASKKTKESTSLSKSVKTIPSNSTQAKLLATKRGPNFLNTILTLDSCVYTSQLN